MLKYIVIILFASLIIQSCNKCVTCTTVTKTTSMDPNVSFPPITDKSSYEFCGTPKEIRQHNESYSLVDTTGNIKLKKNVTTVCN